MKDIGRPMCLSSNVENTTVRNNRVDPITLFKQFIIIQLAAECQTNGLAARCQQPADFCPRSYSRCVYFFKNMVN